MCLPPFCKYLITKHGRGNVHRHFQHAKNCASDLRPAGYVGGRARAHTVNWLKSLYTHRCVQLVQKCQQKCSNYSDGVDNENCRWWRYKDAWERKLRVKPAAPANFSLSLSLSLYLSVPRCIGSKHSLNGQNIGIPRLIYDYPDNFFLSSSLHPETLIRMYRSLHAPNIHSVLQTISEEMQYISNRLYDHIRSNLTYMHSPWEFSQTASCNAGDTTNTCSRLNS
jgi:hypothetical protein